MKSMKLYFAHGKESGPWGGKIKFLAGCAKEIGWEIGSLDYTDLPDDPDARVERLVSRLEAESAPVVLVGSSMGGYVSLVASSKVPVAGLFLMAPALYLPDYLEQDFSKPKCPIEIVHGWGDDVVPPEHSIRFAKNSGTTLHLIDDDHRFSTRLDVLGELLIPFLQKLTPFSPSPRD
jgi:pimeloyl-ACP methyl ester carboxylesterase